MKSTKRLILILCVASIACIFFAGSAGAFKNEPTGFRGIAWGTNISQLPDMIKMPGGEGRDTQVYKRRDEKMQIGDAQITNIAYGFYKGRFSTVIIDYKDLTNAMKLKETLFLQYGDGYRPNQFMEEYHWNSSRVFVSYEYHEISGKGSIGYLYLPITNEEHRDATNKAKSAGADLTDAPATATAPQSPAPIAPQNISTRKLGVNLLPVTDQFAQILKMGEPRGVMVVGVQADSVAKRAGLKGGDVILKFGDKIIKTTAELQQAVAESPQSTVIPLTVYRYGVDGDKGSEIIVNVTF